MHDNIADNKKGNWKFKVEWTCVSTSNSMWNCALPYNNGCVEFSSTVVRAGRKLSEIVTKNYCKNIMYCGFV